MTHFFGWCLVAACCAAAILLAACGNGAEYGQARAVTVSGPDQFGVVCYRAFGASGTVGLACVQVQNGAGAAK